MSSPEAIFEKGNVAAAMGAVDASCRFYFGYPITPQGEIPAFMARELPKIGGTFIQAESEIAAINMLMGAYATGTRAMTSSSGPGISLKQEGLSYLASSEIPAFVINISRSGPGLGGISPSQGDYFQATRGGGHGDYRTLVLAPNSVREMYEHSYSAFDLAEKYRSPVLLLADAVVGQMKEPFVRVPPASPPHASLDWTVTGAKGRPARVLKSLFLGEGEMEAHCWKLAEKYERMKAEDTRFEAAETDDAEIVVVAFGIASRIAKSAVRMARRKGIRAGLFRPITLYPYPDKALLEVSRRCPLFLTVELNIGQMVEDVRLSVGKDAHVDFYGRPPGVGSLPTPEMILERIEKTMQGAGKPHLARVAG